MSSYGEQQQDFLLGAIRTVPEVKKKLEEADKAKKKKADEKK